MNILERFQALAGKREPVEAGCGVVSAADAGYFTGLQLLWAGCHPQAPLALVDLGLTAEQRAWCAGRMQVLAMPPLPIPPTVSRWQAWNKACYLRISPFERTLWLDADCLVVGDLRPLFARISQGPFGIVQPFGGRAWGNKEELYQRFPVSVRLPMKRSVNGGVLGFGADQRARALLDLWEQITTEAGRAPELRDYFVWCDEGALHWTAEKLGLLELGVDERGWNRYCFLPDRGGPAAFLERLTVRPDDVVLHVIIHPKPWRNWGALDAPPPTI
jgi:hypothetical protein